MILDSILAYLTSLVPFIAALIGLIVLDVVLGVACAIRARVFRWREVGDFYLTMIVPFLLGWLAFSVVTNFTSNALLGPEYGQLVSGAVVTFAWMAIVATLGNSIIRNGKYLYGSFPFGQPDNNPEPGQP